MSRRIGILGGTFDPIHMGHLITAEIVRVSAALDEIIFIPAARPPHKENKGEAPAEDRLLMVQCAVEGNPSFSVSDIELKREGPSYTVDTIAVLSEQLRGAELFFITGADAMNDLYRWHDPVRLLHSCTFIVAARQGVELDESRLAEQFSPEQRSRIRIVPTPHLEISSTVIRARVRAGRSIRYLVPRAVELYIEERGLYRAHDKKL
ncbi:nicotinate-nucleotide adenylyltransferase [Selenomonas artemidis]|jgi:nicotinate-nucleotide adenylyltransferase|uniref:Probable nicotinate-nucleotide adenylyltransferase n=1 Tax=Selenomonas artemidis F0399 TaxID=749551 RepID=E7N035_9FIRM|nr:nicotinate-nucleotide adenylyltransferase [Selenomonas artemidis]EFW30699.1 nicotinate-nucleotide adenylyltransferase [Selenomonas artemidis F0399]